MPEATFFLFGGGEITWQSHGLQEKKITSGHTNTEPHFRAVTWEIMFFLTQSQLLFHFEEPNNELGHIQSQLDDIETNFSAPTNRGPSLSFYFGFQGYSYRPQEPGYGTTSIAANYVKRVFREAIIMATVLYSSFINRIWKLTSLSYNFAWHCIKPWLTEGTSLETMITPSSRSINSRT